MKKYISNIDMRLNGKLVRMGTVFYKNANGTFSPYFDRESAYDIEARHLVTEA